MAEDLQSLREREATDSITLNRLPFAFRYRVAEFAGAELKVFMCFLSHANPITKRAFVGMKRLLQETGLSQHGLDNAILGLKKKGWIVRIQLRNGQTGQHATADTFCKWPPAVAGTTWSRIEARKQRDLETVPQKVGYGTAPQKLGYGHTPKIGVRPYPKKWGT